MTWDNKTEYQAQMLLVRKVEWRCKSIQKIRLDIVSLGIFFLNHNEDKMQYLVSCPAC